MIRPRETMRPADPGLSYQRGDTWFDHANCLGTDPEAYFTEGQGAHVPAAVLNTCADCPAWVVQACLDDAIRHGDKFGIRGGTTPEQRSRLKLGDVAPILTRPRCACGALTNPRRKKCSDCIESRQDAYDAKRRAANQQATEEKSA
jgi:hypothetical protein